MKKILLSPDQLSREALIALIVQQAEQIEALQGQVKRLEAQVEKLERQIAKNSTNSSKPPSSDGLKKPAPKSQRERGKRKTGGQPGHNGETLERVDTPDAVVFHALRQCQQCQDDLSEVTVDRRMRRQVFDLPPARWEVTEHQAEVKRCPGCGWVQHAPFPAQVRAPTQYGMRALAQAVYLHSYQLLPLARIQEWFIDWVGHGPSEGTIQRALEQMSAAVAPALDAIYAGVTHAEVVRFDETGLRIAGRLGWLHTASTPDLTYYTVHAQRGEEALLDAGVLPACRGWAVHDGFTSYWGFTTVRHALCNAHHLRELEFLVEQYQAKWAKSMQLLLLTMKHRREAAPQGLSRAVIAALERRYDRLIAQGLAAFPPLPRSPDSKQRVAQHPATNLLLRLRKHRDAVLAFLRHAEVPFDNNLAERDLRMMKVKQKISGCFRTWDGAELFVAIRSYLSTARKQGLSMLHAAHLAFLGSPLIPPLPE